MSFTFAIYVWLGELHTLECSPAINFPKSLLHFPSQMQPCFVSWFTLKFPRCGRLSALYKSLARAQTRYLGLVLP